MGSTKIGQLAQDLAKSNPWWKNSHWALLDPDLKAVKATGMDYQSGALDRLEKGSLYILRGPRRVGKTVAVKQCINDLLTSGVPETCIVRISTDGWEAKDLKNVIGRTTLPPMPNDQTRYWFIDEVSAVKGDWAHEIKGLRDEDPEFREATVVLTGSNARSLTEAAGPLAGRRGNDTNLDRNLFPMGFASFVQIVGKNPLPPRPVISVSGLRSIEAAQAYLSLFPWLDDLVDLWEKYITYGGFPTAVAAAKAGQVIPLAFVNALFDIISNDTFVTSNLDITKEMALLERLWESMANPLSIANVARDIGISHDSVARHLEYLRDSFLLWKCSKRAQNQWLPRGRAQDKFYAVDPVIARLSHLRNPARQDIDLTILTEMLIGQAIRRRLTSDMLSTTQDEILFYMISPNRKEIDFVCELFSGTAIEGKYCEDGGWSGDAATVNASEWDGIMVTRNVLDTSSADTAWAVPAGILCYLLDT